MQSKKRSKVFLCIIVLFLIFLLFAAVVLPFLAKGAQTHRRKKCTAETIGVVVSFADKVVEDHVSDLPNQTYYAPVIMFTTQDGEERLAISNSYRSSKNCRAGETVKVLYDPNDPTNIYLPDKDKGDLISQELLLALVFIVTAVIYIKNR